MNTTRRSMISMSGKALLALGAIGPVTRAVSAGESGSVGWERFLELCHELSESQFAENWDQDRYTAGVEDLIRRLRLDDRRIGEYIARYRNLNASFPEIRTMHYEDQFMVSMLEFEPGEEIPLHDHPGMTGVICCTTGNTAVDHYDRLQETAEHDNPLLKFRYHYDMTAGDIAILTATKGNIHCLKAREFTRMIDVFTPPYNQDRIKRARYYALDLPAYSGRDGTFEAVESRFPPS